ncbi:MAG: iron-containing alcohol dehydrogenase [Aeromicrobium sp.]|nr:iron-containing alcohol dehydrogenase [Aeromicrobium sp.]
MSIARGELRKFVSPEILYGHGARHLAGPYARRIGMARALVVTDPGVEAAGWVTPLLTSLAGNGVEAVVFDDVQPNPVAEQVMRGAALFAESRCDSIVALGGGSPLDCAEGIGVVATNGGHVLDYEGVDMVEAPMPPLVCIPTTAGTGADVSQFAIITDPVRRAKIALVSKSLVPDLALVDPEPLTTMDPALTAATGMDALAHSIEAYLSNASWALTDELALAAMRLIVENLPRCVASGEDLEARAQMALASLDAGLAFSNASLGAVHALAHALGGLLNAPHGECNALLLGPVMRRTLRDTPRARIDSIAEALGVDVGARPAEDVAAWLTEFPAAIGMTTTLAQYGLTPDTVDDLAANAEADACAATNPWDVTSDELVRILRDAIA